MKDYPECWRSDQPPVYIPDGLYGLSTVARFKYIWTEKGTNTVWFHL